MLLLAIESSGRPGGVALCRDGQCLEERPIPESGRRHAQTLVGEIQRLLKARGLHAGAIEAVAVSVGPGSFTGLRVGVTAAKTLAWAVGCPVVAVDTLQAIAEGSPADVNAVHVVANAQRDELFAARYRRDATGLFVADTNVEIVAADQWCAERTTGDVVSGPAATLVADRLAGRCRILEEWYRHPQASLVGRLAHRRLLSDPAGDDVHALEPFYLRKSAAEEKAERGRV